jgi:hypothetical protein
VFREWKLKEWKICEEPGPLWRHGWDENRREYIFYFVVPYYCNELIARFPRG